MASTTLPTMQGYHPPTSPLFSACPNCPPTVKREEEPRRLGAPSSQRRESTMRLMVPLLPRVGEHYAPHGPSLIHQEATYPGIHHCYTHRKATYPGIHHCMYTREATYPGIYHPMYTRGGYLPGYTTIYTPREA